MIYQGTQHISIGFIQAVHLVRGIPAWWLDGKQEPIEVTGAPTTVGKFSFTIRRQRDTIYAEIDCPNDLTGKNVRLHLALPQGGRPKELKVEGEAQGQLDPDAGVVTLKQPSGIVRVAVSR